MKLKERDNNIIETSNDEKLNTLLEQYKLYVHMADNISSRRDTTNKFYTTAITVVLTLATILLNDKLVVFDSTEFVSLFISLLGIGLCINWFVSIESYKQLNSAKFSVINKLEDKLPFQGYTNEYKILKSKNRYRRLTQTEKRVPIILIAPFSFLCLYSIFSLMCSS